MKKVLLSICFFMIAQLFYGQSKDLQSFDAISVAAGHKVSLIKSDKNYAQIEMIKGDLEDLIVEVKNNELKIKSKKSNSWFGNSTKAEVKVFFTQDLNQIDVSSGSSLGSDSKITSDQLDVDVSSGASCSLSIMTDDLDVDVSSGARLTLKGSAKTQDVNASSGAKYKADYLDSEFATVDVSSGAKAEVNCTRKIKGDASSGGKIVYSGNPKEVNVDSGKYSGGSIKSK